MNRYQRRLLTDDELLEEAQALDAQYESAAAFDNANSQEPPEDYCDEMEELRKAGAR